MRDATPDPDLMDSPNLSEISEGIAGYDRCHNNFQRQHNISVGR